MIQTTSIVVPGKAPWGVHGRLAFALRLNAQTPSGNVLKRMHFHTLRQLQWDFRMLLLQSLNGAGVGAPLDLALLHIRRYSSGSLDWDNAIGGIKPLVDCLVLQSDTHPAGLGLIRDDSPKHIPLPPFMEQLPAPKKKGFTEVFIYETTAEALKSTGFFSANLAQAA